MLRTWWACHQTALLSLAIVLMSVAVFVRLRNEFSRLLWETGLNGAVDLKLRHYEVHKRFSGNPVYSDIWGAIYPPASYAILWSRQDASAA
jgi:hypothetical protein